MRQMIPKMKTNGSAMEVVKNKDSLVDAKVGKPHSDITKEQKGGNALTRRTATLISVKCVSDGACIARKLAVI